MEECVGTVHFLQSGKISGRHEKLVRMQFSQQHRCNTDHLLLEPDHPVLHQLGLDIEFALLSIDEDNYVNIPVCNYNMNAQYLDKGQMVGRLYPMTSPNSDSDEDSEGTSEVVEVRTLGTPKSDSDDNHWEKLCKVLRVSE